MKIKEVIALLEKEGSWVNWNQTRDHVLLGDIDNEITKIGVCWVASKQVIEEAIAQGINFIISHENPFYTMSTKPVTAVFDAIHEKQQMLRSKNITIYRCHDVWDSMPIYGVSDQWAKRLGYNFAPRVISSYYQYADITTSTVQEIAQHVALSLVQDGEDGVYIFGNIHKEVRRIAMGTGAATDIFEMLAFQPDAVIVSDDGITNYYHAQFAIDHDLPMIVVNHAGCEICGLKGMQSYLQERLSDISIMHLQEGYHIHYVLGK